MKQREFLHVGHRILSVMEAKAPSMEIGRKKIKKI